MVAPTVWSSPEPATTGSLGQTSRSGRHGPQALSEPPHSYNSISSRGPSAAPNPSAALQAQAPPAQDPAAGWLAGFTQVIYLGFVPPQHLQTNIDAFISTEWLSACSGFPISGNLSLLREPGAGDVYFIASPDAGI